MKFVICQWEKEKEKLSPSHWKRIVPLRTSLNIPSLHSNSFVMGLLLCNRTSPFVIKMFLCDVTLWSLFLLNFTPLHAAIFLSAFSFKTYQTFLSFYINFHISFFRTYALFFLVENYPVTYIFPYGETESRLTKPSVISPSCDERGNYYFCALAEGRHFLFIKVRFLGVILPPLTVLYFCCLHRPYFMLIWGWGTLFVLLQLRFSIS